MVYSMRTTVAADTGRHYTALRCADAWVCDSLHLLLGRVGEEAHHEDGLRERAGVGAQLRVAAEGGEELLGGHPEELGEVSRAEAREGGPLGSERGRERGEPLLEEALAL
eukprot:TRINITY_DN35356_c0_g1_i1.p5 TRINITY_DN35356_c0_g1~~TRINITY_DN35356_c0_g1_i1.p5  ORF type:complete len:110 (-),score=4.65 TRINITY_DN35356_c0_g1_i1:528-857(-)